MTSARFKSRDDYFTKRSGLARHVITRSQESGVRRQKSPKKDALTPVSASLVNDLFCRTVDSFEIEGKGRFTADDYPLEEAVKKHLSGDETVRVNPMSKDGVSAWNTVRFLLSDSMDHPFTKAKQFADELRIYGIRSLIEVTEGGKGDYHLWLFHEEPVDGRAFSEALERLGSALFGVTLDTAPPVSGEVFVPLPLQGESLLFQRRVFVNGVGKMIKDQSSVLRAAPLNTSRAVETFVEKMRAEKPLETPAAERPVKSAAEKPPVLPTEIPAVADTGPAVQKKPEPEPPAVESAKPSLKPELPKATKPSGTKFLVVNVRKEEFGIESGSVNRVMMPEDMSPVPGSLPVTGTVIDGDRIIPVFDAGDMLQKKQCTMTPRSRILIVRRNGTSAALLVDGVDGIRRAAALRENHEPATQYPLTAQSAEINGADAPLPCIDPDALVSLAGHAVASKEPGRDLRGIRCLIFSVNGFRCGFPADSIREITLPENIPASFESDATLQGVIRYGTSYLPVIDVRSRVVVPEDQAGSAVSFHREAPRRRIIIVQANERLVGASVDVIEGIETIAAGNVDPAPTALTESTPVSGFVRGTGTSPGFMLLDPDQLV